MYSADVVDSHRAPTAGQASAERPDAPPPPQNSQPASAPTLPDSRAVIILIPVRLGGEKINPEYFDFAKVRPTCSLGWFLELCFSEISFNFVFDDKVLRAHSHTKLVSGKDELYCRLIG